MRQKILKWQLISLFLLTLGTFVFYYFQGSLPDSYLSISSENESINFFSYGLTSLLAMMGYYLGPWLILPFLSFAFCYGFIFNRRDYELDSFALIFFLGMFSFGAYLFFPLSLGGGLLYLFKTYITELSGYLGLATLLLASFAVCFRSSFKAQVLNIFDSLRDMAHRLLSIRVRPKFSFGNFIGRAKLKITSNLRSEEKQQVEPQTAVYQEEPKTNFEPQRQEPARAAEPSIAPKAIVNTARPAKQSKIRPVNSKELINCLVPKKSTKNINPDESYFRAIIERIEDKLSEFNIDAKIIHILKGPVVDTFELELGEGVRVARVTSLTQDLSLALSGAPIRMIYPMEGKTTMGIEVPRDPREVIYLDEVLDTDEFKSELNVLGLAMGKDAFGNPFISDLTKMPHMLVAGATGAGKSVFINTLLVSLLVKMSPERLKLILIDPKQLELALYRNLPHLILPVVTDPSTASLALLWAVEEMERRYTILSKLGVRSIDGFNRKVKTASKETMSMVSHLYEGIGDSGYELPYTVIIVDEFADLILTKNGKNIENNICRLAAKARACGIHLVIATQRPSVDVITGLIKANFPTRVSFRVTASQDSRTILNSAGAENLLGKGDMLYKHGVEMRRLHSAYVDEEEIAQLVKMISTDEPQFDEKALEFLENGGDFIDGGSSMGGGMGSSSDTDPLYQDAVKVVLEHRAASASMLQRRLKVGYNRAANLIESMEANGVVGPQQGSKPRQVLQQPQV